MNQSKRETRGFSKPVGDISHELREWAIEEMGFRPHGRHVNQPLPSVEDFKL